MIKEILYPKSVAIIGVSSNPKKIGHTIARNIISYGYKGKIYFVNTSGKKILGKESFASINDIKNVIDLAVIAVPAEFVGAVLEECGKKKVKSAIVISAGFSEIGQEGKRLEDEIVAIAKKYSISVLGPNCLGVLNSSNKLNLSFADGMIQPGSVGFISQSGAICSAMLDWAVLNDFGFSQFVSLGNKAVLDEVDFLKEFSKDSKTKYILAYLEEINRGKNFIDTVEKISTIKPVVVLKSGTTNEGKMAASSHTGSLAGDDMIIESAFKKANIIRAQNLEEFFNISLFLAWQPMITGKNVAILSNAGGPAVITTDIISKSRLQLAELSDDTKNVLKKILPKSANVHNPVDIVGDADALRYKNALNAILKDENVHAVIVLLTPQTVTEIAKTAHFISDVSKKYKKPLIACFLGGKKVAQGIKILNKKLIPTFDFPEKAVSALDAIARYSMRVREASSAKESVRYRKIIVGIEKYEAFKRVIVTEKESGKKQLSFKSCGDILRAYEVPLVNSISIASVDELKKSLSSLPDILVAKVDSQDIIHKTDTKGVLVDIKKEDALSAYESIVKNVLSKNPNAKISGVIFQEMLKDRLEIIVGAKRDKQFGSVVLLGMGGIYAEVFKDVSVKIAPVSKSDARSMIQEVGFYPIIAGARGKAGYDEEAIIDIINKISQIMTDFPEIQEIDLNPVMVGAKNKGLKAVDFRIII